MTNGCSDEPSPMTINEFVDEAKRDGINRDRIITEFTTSIIENLCSESTLVLNCILKLLH